MASDFLIVNQWFTEPLRDSELFMTHLALYHQGLPPLDYLTHDSSMKAEY